MKRLSMVLDVIVAIFGCVWTTILVCDSNPNPNDWYLIGWTLSLIAVGRVLCTKFKRPDSDPIRRGISIPLAAVAVFCFALLTLTTIRLVQNQQPLPMDDFVFVSTFAALGLTSAFFAIRLS